ncbi:MAG: hypothetical protein MJE66_06805 [Proteobacteria bacterium]|nr:hypothetical protein [Pseudomonadota bacterium]
MTSLAGLRVAIGGATGALGGEVLAVLEERRFPVRELLPFASDASTGREVEFFDEALPVVTETPSLRHLDLLFLCTPAAVTLELVREALRASVPCIDCSGALSGSPEVPLLVAERCDASELLGTPVVSSPAGPALAWYHALAALADAAPLLRVHGTVLRSAAGAGRGGIESLSRETLALLSQRELPEPDVFETPVAFDCVPTVGPVPDATGATADEAGLERDLGRLLGDGVAASASLVQVPTFAGDGSLLAVETRQPLAVEVARAALAKAPAVELFDAHEPGPTVRDTVGRDVALVGRVRADPSVPDGRGLLLWVAADATRLAAANAVKLAETRPRLHS